MLSAFWVFLSFLYCILFICFLWFNNLQRSGCVLFICFFFVIYLYPSITSNCLAYCKQTLHLLVEKDVIKICDSMILLESYSTSGWDWQSFRFIKNENLSSAQYMSLTLTVIVGPVSHYMEIANICNSEHWEPLPHFDKMLWL